MWNETYHPLSEESLNGILNEGCWTEEEKRLIRDQVEAATAGKIRNYTVFVSENRWFKVENGQVPSRSNE